MRDLLNPQKISTLGSYCPRSPGCLYRDLSPVFLLDVGVNNLKSLVALNFEG